MGEAARERCRVSQSNRDTVGDQSQVASELIAMCYLLCCCWIGEKGVVRAEENTLHGLEVVLEEENTLHDLGVALEAGCNCS